MAAIYHQVIAYVDKHRKMAERGNARAIRRLASKSLHYADDGSDHTVDRVARIMNSASRSLLHITKSMKHCVLFHMTDSSLSHQKPSAAPNGVRMPYDACVFICDVPDYFWNFEKDKFGGDTSVIIRQFMIVAWDKMPEDNKISLSVFVRRTDNPDDWTYLPALMLVDRDALQDLAVKSFSDKVKFVCEREISIAERTLGASAFRFFLNALTTLSQQNHTLQTINAQGTMSPVDSKHGRFYEHKVIVIDPDNPVYSSSDGLGCSGRKHALHSVRGFWRNLKKPKADGSTRVWVNAHWRGDKELGVVTKEYRVLNTKSQP